jgi:hypothetical protein
MAQRRTWIVTLSGDRKAAEVKRDLAAAGLSVGEVMEAIGVITATGDEAAAGRARAVAGVADVAPDTTVDIGPPGSDRTW